MAKIYSIFNATNWTWPQKFIKILEKGINITLASSPSFVWLFLEQKRPTSKKLFILQTSSVTKQTWARLSKQLFAWFDPVFTHHNRLFIAEVSYLEALPWIHWFPVQDQLSLAKLRHTQSLFDNSYVIDLKNVKKSASLCGFVDRNKM